MTADLIVLGRVTTGDPKRPRAEAVAVLDGRIAAIGEAADVEPLRGGRTEVLGSRDSGVVPGFVDAHLHLVALARRAAEVDCSRERARSVGEVVAIIAAAAERRPSGTWIRAFGYDEFFLAEKRPPTVAELDSAAPRHPVRLLHRTGHAAVLNRRAFERLHVAPREVIYEPARILHGEVPAPDATETGPLVRAASDRLLAAGITAFCDTTPGRGAKDVQAMRAWASDGTIRQRAVVFGEPDRVKLMVTEESDAGEVIETVAAADRAGAQIALHAVEGGPLAVAVSALRSLGAERVRARRHRIEHASLCPPPLCEAIAESGATVVTHPIFLEEFGEKYRSEVSREEHEWLYPLRSLRDARVPIAFGSDAPIAPAAPLANVQAAVCRQTEDGSTLGAAQALTVAEALDVHTRGSAAAVRLDATIGSLVVGKAADLVLVETDPLAVSPNEIASIGVRATVIGGRVAWHA